MPGAYDVRSKNENVQKQLEKTDTYIGLFLFIHISTRRVIHNLPNGWASVVAEDGRPRRGERRSKTPAANHLLRLLSVRYGGKIVENSEMK